jgi:hypothetical protein
MPRQAIAEEHRTNAAGDIFPRLKFREKGEKGRIAFYEKPWKEWVHQLRVPIIKEDGRPKKLKRESRFGKEYEVFDTDFVSNPICLGGIGVLDVKGVDPDSCPVCAAAMSASGESNLRPRQRFAANVVRYFTKPGSYDIRIPFGCTVEVWAFTDTMYDDLLDLQKELPDQNIQLHDVLLECEIVEFQRVKMGTRLVPGWQEYPEGIGIIQQLLAEPGNTATDEQLREACGRDRDRAYMQEDADMVLRRWRQIAEIGSTVASGAGDTAALGGGADQLQSGIDNLMQGGQAVQSEQQAPAAAAQSPFGGGGQAPVAAAAEPAPAQAAAPAPGEGLSQFTTTYADQQANLGIPLDGQQAAQAAAPAPAAAANPFATQPAATPAPAAAPSPASVAPAVTLPTAPPSEPAAAAATPAAKKMTFEQMIEGLT